MKDDWLEKMGVFGWGKERAQAIAVGLITGHPILFVGAHGTGKTYFVRKIAEWLGLQAGVYDASKSAFEDLIGFVKAQALNEDRVEYVQTELSIWSKEFIFIDELARATPQLANKWLEIIQARTLMGNKLEKVKYVWAATNPSSGTYVGTNFLDRALLDRFIFLIQVPQFSDVDDEAILRKIIGGRHDRMACPLIPFSEVAAMDENLDHFLQRMEEIRREMEHPDEEESKLWESYIVYLFSSINAQEKQSNMISFRTATALHKALLALGRLNFSRSPEDLDQQVLSLVSHSLPVLRIAEGMVRPFPFRLHHGRAWESTFSSQKKARKLMNEHEDRHRELLAFTRAIILDHNDEDKQHLFNYTNALDKALSQKDDHELFSKGLACLLFMVTQEGFYRIQSDYFYRQLDQLHNQFIQIPYPMSIEFASRIGFLIDEVVSNQLLLPTLNAFVLSSFEMLRKKAYCSRAWQPKKASYFRFLKACEHNQAELRQQVRGISESVNHFIKELRF